jgi:aspartate 1-decarboxylase
MHLSRSVPGIERFQVEQRDRDGVIFRFVPGPGWEDRFVDDLAGRIREQCGDGFRVDIMPVADMPSAPAGTFPLVISRIGEREVVKSKIHKARVTAENSGTIDCLSIDGDLMDLGAIARFEQILIVDNTNGARVRTLAVMDERGSGSITAGGAVSKHIHMGDEISIMAFAWSDGSDDVFSNFLVDGNNRFVRYMKGRSGKSPGQRHNNGF